MNAIKTLDNRFTGLENSFTGLDNRFADIDTKFTLRFDQTDAVIAELQEAIQVLASDTDQQIMMVRSQMVTKDYLDEKMGDLRGDMVQRIRTRMPKLAL